MRWINIFLLVAASLLQITSSKNEETNEILPTPPKINLDANLRRALLKALTELENEENSEETRSRTIEKAQASAVSFFTHLSSTEEPPKTSTSMEMEKSVVIVQRSKGLQHKPITTFEPKAEIEREPFLTSASSSFAINGKKNEKELGRTSSNPNFISSDVKYSTRKRIEATTPTTTTTTTTEESEAKVEDVQFFSAPLVAAFTVNQDESGIPRSVIPIYKNDLEKIKHEKELQTQKEAQLKQEQLKRQQLLEEEERSKKEKEQEQLKTQQELRQNQKALEEEILRLRQQQEQQQLLIRQQQLFHEQQLNLQKQNLEEQFRFRNNEQPFIPIITPLNPHGRNQGNISRVPFTPFNSLNNQPNNSGIKPNTVVSFQPSVNLNPVQQQQQLPLNAQQLPVKSPIDFNSPIFRIPQPYKPFNFQQLPSTQVPTFNQPFVVQPFRANNQIVKSVQPFGVQHVQDSRPFFTNSFGTQPVQSFTSNTVQSINPFSAQPTANNLRIQAVNTFKNQPIDQIQITTSAPTTNFVLPQHNRVFRNEAGVGNSGTNQLQQNRYFRSNLESTFTSPQHPNRIQPPVFRQHLNNLLYNSGISRGKQQEDLNIVSKILSLHPYDPVSYDFNFASSNINEQRVKKV